MGFSTFLEGKKDVGRLINSFLMLLVSSAKHTKSTVMVGILSRLNDENKPGSYAQHWKTCYRECAVSQKFS